MGFFESSTKKIAEIYEKFNEIKIRIDYVEKGTRENTEDFKKVIEKFEDKLNKVEHDLTEAKIELHSEVNNLKTLFESVYKESIKSTVNELTEKRIAQMILNTKDKN